MRLATYALSYATEGTTMIIIGPILMSAYNLVYDERSCLISGIIRVSGQLCASQHLDYKNTPGPRVHLRDDAFPPVSCVPLPARINHPEDSTRG